MPVTGLSGAVAVSAGVGHSCALLSTGEVDCWGSNAYGELGDGTTTDSPTPIRVTVITDAVAVSASEQQSCALRASGVVMCWGMNLGGSLGTGSTTGPESCPFGQCATTPVQVTAITTAVAVSSNFAPCALLASGHVDCWGDNTFGQLGIGYVGGSGATPVEVQGVDAAVAVTAGTYHNCALLSGGHVACWGQNPWNGKDTCGFGSPCDLTGAVVPDLTDAVGVSAGQSFTCALRRTGQVVCWGAGEGLGVGSTDGSAVPVTVTLP